MFNMIPSNVLITPHNMCNQPKHNMTSLVFPVSIIKAYYEPVMHFLSNWHSPRSYLFTFCYVKHLVLLDYYRDTCNFKLNMSCHQINAQNITLSAMALTTTTRFKCNKVVDRFFLYFTRVLSKLTNQLLGRLKCWWYKCILKITLWSKCSFLAVSLHKFTLTFTDAHIFQVIPLSTPTYFLFSIGYIFPFYSTFCNHSV